MIQFDSYFRLGWNHQLGLFTVVLYTLLSAEDLDKESELEQESRGDNERKEYPRNINKRWRSYFLPSKDLDNECYWNEAINELDPEIPLQKGQQKVR